MRFYDERILPHITDFVCGTKMLRTHRERTCAGLRGNVVEIGFGSGLNVPFYPAAVDSVAAVEPADVGWRLASKRIAAARTPIERSGLDGQHLPFGDKTFDSALSTFTLCTIADVGAALREVRRVLKPGGTFHFVEHGLAPDRSVQKWQNRCNPIQNAVAGGCNLNRDIKQLIIDAGFEIREVDIFYEQGSPKTMGAMSLGVAVR